MDLKKSFRGDLDFCSNFYNCHFTWRGVDWGSSENAYVAAKFNDKAFKRLGHVIATMDSGQAKVLGQNIKLRDDWEDTKLQVMEEILVQKFSAPRMMELLKRTGTEELIEWNYWNDKFWGKCLRTWEGENNLGKLLMKIRDENNNKISK